MKHVREPAGRHRAGVRDQAGVRHRAEVRPRYGRMAVLGSSAAVTAIAVLGGFGALPIGAAGGASADPAPTTVAAPAATPTASGTPTAKPAEESTEKRAATSRERADRQQVATTAAPDEALPPDSGSGLRVVFSEGRQRVWLVDDAEQVLRTYPVSGSVYDNLDPGTYQVYSKSRYAVGIDDSGAMEYFVRFTQGDQGAAIGFHTIPVADGAPVQTIAQLGTPLSHGCIRQRTEDAVALWEFAPIGTTVVVTA